MAAWFEGTGERWADDVVIRGARFSGTTQEWSEPFELADVPGYPDINPVLFVDPEERLWLVDRKSTRLNSSHVAISYAVFCLKKKTRQKTRDMSQEKR